MMNTDSVTETISKNDLFWNRFANMNSDELGRILLLEQYVCLASMSSMDISSYHEQIDKGFESLDRDKFPNFDIELLRLELLNSGIDGWQFLPDWNDLLYSYIKFKNHNDIILFINYKQLCGLISNYFNNTRIYAERIASGYEFLAGRYELLDALCASKLNLEKDKIFVLNEISERVEAKEMQQYQRWISSIGKNSYHHIDYIKSEENLFRLAYINISSGSKQQIAYHYALTIIGKQYGIPFELITKQRYKHMIQNIKRLNKNVKSLCNHYPEQQTLWRKLFPGFHLQEKPDVRSLRLAKHIASHMEQLLNNPFYLISLLCEGMN